MKGARLVAGVALVALYLGPIGWVGLAEPDEGRYAEIAREMRVLHDWVTPHLNYVKYFEKPPLVYWLTAAAQALFGLNEFAARLVPALCGLLTVLCTALLARDMFGARRAWLAAAILGTAPFFAAMSQTLTLDVPLTACTTAAATCFWFGYRRPARRARWYLGLYVAVAAGILVKGPVAAVIAGLSIVVFLALRREWREILALIRLDGLALAALIVVPWFVLVSRRNPEFPYFFFVREHLERYTTTGEHHAPPWYYLPIILGGMAPWSLLPLADPRSWWPRPARWLTPGHQFCAVWAAAILLFFTLSVSKVGTYALPLFPPVALLLAEVAWRQLDTGRTLGLRVAGWVCAVLGVLCVATSQVLDGLLFQPAVVLLTSRLAPGGVVLLATGAGILWCVRKTRVPQALAVLAVGLALFVAVAMLARGVMTQYRELIRTVAAAARPDDVIASYGQYVQGLPFYTGRRVVVVKGWGELDFGRQQGDNAAYFWPTDDELRAAWSSDRRVLLVINRMDLEALRPSLDPAPIEITTQGKKVAVTNRAG